MLPRSTHYKPRKDNTEIKTINNNNIIKKGRKLSDFNEYINSHPNASVVEMDTVIGKFEDKTCIMTLYFRKSKLMLMYLIPKYNPCGVVKIFDQLKELLGIKKFKEMFEVILTDNGWEFSKPLEIECDSKTGEKIINLYYCEPYSSWQKGGIERNHEFIRYIIAKGITFDTLTNKNTIDMSNHINSVTRKSLDFRSPYEIFQNQYGKDISMKLLLRYISKEEVNLSYKILK